MRAGVRAGGRACGRVCGRVRGRAGVRVGLRACVWAGVRAGGRACVQGSGELGSCELGIGVAFAVGVAILNSIENNKYCQKAWWVAT